MSFYFYFFFFFLFKQKTAYEILRSDWSSDVCSSDPSRRRHTRTPVTPENLVCRLLLEIGRASCRERVCQYVYISVDAGSLKKKKGPTTVRPNHLSCKAPGLDQRWAA